MPLCGLRETVLQPHTVVRPFVPPFIHALPFYTAPKDNKERKREKEEGERVRTEGEGRFTERFHGLNRVVNCSVFCQLVPYYRLIHLVEEEVVLRDSKY